MLYDFYQVLFVAYCSLLSLVYARFVCADVILLVCDSEVMMHEFCLFICLRNEISLGLIWMNWFFLSVCCTMFLISILSNELLLCLLSFFGCCSCTQIQPWTKGPWIWFVLLLKLEFLTHLNLFLLCIMLHIDTYVQFIERVVFLLFIILVDDIHTAFVKFHVTSVYSMWIICFFLR